MLPLVLPPLPRELLMRGENGIPARIRHQITHNRCLNVNSFHGLTSRVAPGEHDAGNQNLAADFQRVDFFFGEGKRKFRHNNSNRLCLGSGENACQEFPLKVQRRLHR